MSEQNVHSSKSQMLDDTMNAVALRDKLASGTVDAEKVVATCLEQIEAKEPDVQAWAWVDPGHALKQAQELDVRRRAGESIGPLHGLPIGIKDVIDTAGIPTCNGTSLDAGRVPSIDSFVAQQLKRAGAVILGKTVTTELAFLEPNKTRHPQDATRTPGGSSSGSAAAVACGMVPLAVGTQTGGSVIRPAAFCGVTGFKPSFGKIPRAGVLNQSQTLDTIGVFGRTVSDVALLAECLYGDHADDLATQPLPHPQLLSTALSEPSTMPVFAFVKTPFWLRAEPPMQKSLEALASALGERCFNAELPSLFADTLQIRTRINQVEMAKNFSGYADRGKQQLSGHVQDFMEVGGKVLACDYLSALEWRSMLNANLDDIFDRFDAIITPATVGPAPGIESTGDPLFNGLWTLCGTPAITLPLFSAEDGMPMGVQLVGRRNDDARLLRTARWLETHVASGG